MSSTFSTLLLLLLKPAAKVQVGKNRIVYKLPISVHPFLIELKLLLQRNDLKGSTVKINYNLTRLS